MKAADRDARRAENERQQNAMRLFIDECRSCMTVDEWDHYYTEAEASAGETFHIVRDLIFALTETQTPIKPSLRKSIDAVVTECGIDRDRWSDLRRLKYDDYWRSRYGYDANVGTPPGEFCPHSPSEPGK